MIRELSILHAEDNPHDAELIRENLKAQGIAPAVLRVESMEDFLLALEQGTYDLIISDFTMPTFDGLRALRIAKEKAPNTPFIYVSGTIGEERAVEALRNGAIDYVLKDKLYKLGPAVEHALRESALRAQRHLAEEELHKAHGQLQRILAASPAIIYTKAAGPEATLMTSYISENVETILGYKTERFITSPGFWMSHVHPADRQAFLQYCSTSRQPSMRSLAYRFRRADGEYRWLTDESRLIEGGQHEVFDLVGSIVDVSELKEMEAKRWESEAKFRVLAERSPSLILIWRGETLIYANNRCLDLLGVGREETISSAFMVQDLVAEESRDAMKSAVETLDAGGEIAALNVIFNRPGGSKAYCVITGTQIAYEEKPANMILATDVSELQTLQEEKVKLHEQFQQSQKMEAVGRLAGGIAHDFNNMLMVIQGYVDILKSKSGGEASVQGYLGEIKKAVNRATSLTQQLLVFSRKQILKVETISMRSIVEEAGKMINRVIGDDVELSLLLGEGPDSVKVDQGQMSQVLINLAVNARDAMPNGGRLTIRTRTEDNTGGHDVILEVRDTGVGMDAEIQTHIFEPFFTTKQVGKGTGLGLANAYGIVKQSGGVIKCTSEVGKGASFFIRLPLVEGAQTESGEPGGVKAGNKGTERILLVEDDENVRAITKMILEGAGYSVQVAVNGEEALGLWRSIGNDIDLVISDIVMPVIRGPEMARRIRQHSPNMRFFFMSGYADEGQGALRLSEEDSVLQKPATPEKFLSEVRKTLDGRKH